MPKLSDKALRGVVWWVYIVFVTVFVVYKFLVLMFWHPAATFYQDVWPYTLTAPVQVTKSDWRSRCISPQLISLRLFGRERALLQGPNEQRLTKPMLASVCVRGVHVYSPCMPCNVNTYIRQ